MTLGPNEQIRAIIGIEYVGASDVQRYLADLQRLGGLTDQAAARIGQAWQQASTGVLSYGRALREISSSLNQSETSMRRLERQLEGVAFGRNEAAIRSYTNQLRQLDGMARQVTGTFQALAQARQRLASVAATNLGAMAYDVQQGPVALAAARRPLELSATATPQPVTAAADPSSRRMDRILASLEAQEARGNVVSGGNPFAAQRASVDFERLHPQLEQTRSRVEALNSALAGITSSARRLSLQDPAVYAEAARRAQEVNRGALMQLASQHGGTGNSDYNDFLRRMAESTPQYPADRRLLTYGEFMPTHVKNNPDLVRGLFGAEQYELRQGVGRGGAAAALPGGTNPEAQLRELQAEYDAAMLRNVTSRQQRLYRALIRTADQVGALSGGTNAYASMGQLQRLWQQSFPIYGQTQLETRAAVESRRQFGPYGTLYTPTLDPITGGYGIRASHPEYGPMGQMRLMPSGTIDTISVLPRYQRQGIATGMLEAARAAGIDAYHSATRTAEGEAWSRTTAGTRPSLAGRSQYEASLDEMMATAVERGMTRALPRALGDRLPVPYRPSFGQAELGNILYGGQYRHQMSQRPMTIGYNQAGYAYPGYMLPGQGASWMPMRSQWGPQTVPGEVLGSTTTPIRSQWDWDRELSDDAKRAARALRSVGGDTEQADRMLSAMGFSAERSRAALAEAAIAQARQAAAEQQQATATQQATQATQAETSARRAATGTLNAWRSGMGMGTPAMPPRGAPGFIAGPEGITPYAASNLPAVINRTTGAQAELYTGIGPVRQAYLNQARVLGQQAAATQATTAAQARFRQSISATQTSMLSQRLARGYIQAGTTAYGAGYTPPPALPPLPPGGGGGGYYGAAGAAGGGGGLFGAAGANFMAGFRGRSDRPYMEQLGQTFKFATFYGTAYKILFAITQTFSATLQEAIAFQTAMVDLNIATGKTTEANQQLADQLGKTATEAGFQPGEGVTAGARAIGMYGLTEASYAEQSVAARQSARVATMLALGSGRPYQDIQADLGAIAQGFNTGYAGQERVADLDAYLSRKFGITPGSTLQPVAETAGLANLAGFSLPEAVAISANLQSRTGQSASTIGGLLTQIFSRSGEGSLLQVAQRYGVDTRQNLRGQLEDLGTVYRQVGPTQQAEIAASFGRGRSQNVAAVLLGDSANIFREAAEAAGKSSGAAEKQFDQRLANVGGQLAQLGGDFMQFAKLLGESGLLDVIGLGVKALQGLFNAVNPVLEMFAALPGPISDVILALGALAVTAKMGGFGAMAGGLAARGYGAASPIAGAGAGMASQLRYLPAGPMGQMVPVGTGYVGRMVPTGNLGQSVPVRSTAALGMAAQWSGEALMSLVNPVTIAIGGLMAIGAVKGSMDRFTETTDALRQTAVTLRTTMPKGGWTGQDIANQATMYGQLADQAHGSIGAFTNIATLGYAGRAADDLADRAKAEQQYRDRLARRLQAAEEAQTPETTPLFSALDTEGITAGLDLLATSGRTTQQQMNALARALLHAGNAAQEAKEKFRPKESAQELAPTLYDAIRGGRLPSFVGETLSTEPGALPNTVTGGEIEYALESSGYLSSPNLNRRLQSAYKRLGIGSERELNIRAPEVAELITQNVVNQLPPGLKPEQRERIMQLIRRMIVRQIRRGTALQAKLQDPDRMLTAQEARAGAETFTQGAETRMGELEEGDFAGRTRISRQLVSRLRGLTQRTQDPVPRVLQLLAQAERNLAENRINQLEELRRAAQAGADSQRQIAAIGRRYMRQEARVAVRHQSIDAIRAVIDRGGKEAYEAVKETLQASLRIAIAAARARQELFANLQALVKSTSGGPDSILTPGIDESQSPFAGWLPDELPTVDNDPRVRWARRALRALSGIPYSRRKKDNQFVRPDDVPGLEYDEDGTKKTDREDREARRLDRLAARDAARAAKRGDDVSAARADLADARRRLDAAKPHSQAWYEALQQVYESQRALGDAISARSTAMQRAQVAPDDAVGQARADMQEALAAMRRAPRNSAQYWEAVAQYRQAQQAYAQSQNEVADAAGAAAAARDGGAIASAKQQIASAARALHDATPGTAAYFEALQSMYEGQQALADAVLQYQANVRLLSGDITNPLFQARVALRTARDKLQRDIEAGRGEDVIAQDRVDARQQQAEVEATKFQQRLDRVQTAEQLGRISHSAYINYLENEQKRLRHIGNRTYQQQQQLNQIDQLLKDASDAMQGQFNLGDIHLPTPYQVRRYIEQRAENLTPSRRDVAGGRAAAMVNSNNSTTIQIDGADTRKVRQIINEALGSQPRRVTTAPRRR